MSKTTQKGKTKSGWSRTLFALLIVPAFLIFGAYFFVARLDPQSLLNNAMAGLGGSASFDSFNYRFPDSVSATGVKISIGNKNSLKLKSFLLNIDWSSIGTGLIRVDKLRIVRPEIKADLPELKKLFTGKGSGGSTIPEVFFLFADRVRLEIKKAAIDDIDMVIDDGTGQKKIDRTSITLSGTADINNAKFDLVMTRKAEEAPVLLHLVATGNRQNINGTLSLDMPKAKQYFDLAGIDFVDNGSISFDKVRFSADQWQSQKSVKLDGVANIDFGKTDLPKFSFPEGLRAKLNFTNITLSPDSIDANIALDFDPLLLATPQSGNIKISAGKTRLEISADLDKNYKPANLKGNLDIKKGLSISSSKANERLENIEAKIKFKSSAPLDFRFVSNVDISGKFVQDDLMVPFHFAVAGKSDENFDSVAFKDFRVALAGNTKIRADGKIDLVKKSGALKLDIESSDLPLLVKIMPDDLKSKTGIESLDGKVSMTLDYTGSLVPPDFARLDKFDGSAEISIKTESLSISASKYKLSATGFTSDFQISTKGASANIAGSAEVDELVYKNIFGDKPIDPVMTFDVNLNRTGRLNIDNFMLDTQAFGFVESLSGYVEGFSASNLLAIAEDKTRALELLSFELKNYTRLYLDENRKFSSRFSVAGDTTIDLELSHHRESKSSVKGVAQFDSLDIRQNGEKIVTGLSGTFPFEKTLLAGTTEVLDASAGRKEKSIRETRFFADIMQVTPDRHIVRLKQVMAGPVVVSDGEFDISFVQDRLGIDYFRADLMGGSMSGSFLVKKEDDRFIMKSSQVFTGLDIENLLPAGEKPNKKLSKVDGTMVVSVMLGGVDEGDDEQLGIDNIDMNLQLTSIGTKALDRFLMFLDPEQSKPAIVNVRRLLTFARPAGVFVFLKGGALSVSISLAYSPLLGGQKVNMDVVKRAPVAQLVKFGAIQKKLHALKTVTSIMRLIGAQRYYLDESGMPVLK